VARAESGEDEGEGDVDDADSEFRSSGADDLGVVPAQDQRVNSAYLFVDDADVLAEEWRSTGVQVHTPQDTEWGQHEGAVVEPDGNVIRFGSPM
jgi:hypothetical protein